MCMINFMPKANQSSMFNLQPTVIDWADAVNEVGASELAKEIMFNLQNSFTLDTWHFLVYEFTIYCL